MPLNVVKSRSDVITFSYASNMAEYYVTLVAMGYNRRGTGRGHRMGCRIGHSRGYRRAWGARRILVQYVIMDPPPF